MNIVKTWVFKLELLKIKSNIIENIILASDSKTLAKYVVLNMLLASKYPFIIPEKFEI
jgi:hypothetical protein